MKKIGQKLFLLMGGALALCGCSAVDLLNLTIPRSGYSVISDIAYGDDPRQKLDIYVPDVMAPHQPVMVFFYGGSWQSGSKNQYLFVGQAFASLGYVTVIADYRLYPQVYFPTFMQDCAAAFVWAHNHIADYGGNPGTMFVSGHSAGAYNAIMLTVNDDYLRGAGGQSSWIRGAIGIAGPYDFLPFTDPNIIALFGKVDARLTQPITYAKPGLPPMLLVAGDADTEVLPRNTANLAAKLRGYDDNVTTHYYPGIAHIDIALALANGFRRRAPVLDDVAAFVGAVERQ